MKRIPVYLSVEEMRVIQKSLVIGRVNGFEEDKLYNLLSEHINLNEEPEITGAALEAANEEDYERSLKDCK